MRSSRYLKVLHGLTLLYTLDEWKLVFDVSICLWSFNTFTLSSSRRNELSIQKVQYKTTSQRNAVLSATIISLVCFLTVLCVIS